MQRLISTSSLFQTNNLEVK